jgi:DNA-binding CsgD family transcriptional regulator
MRAGWEPERLIDEVERLSMRALPREEYFRELAERLRRTVAIDGTCWHGLDPRTLLMTSAHPEELHERALLPGDLIPVAGRLLVAAEYEHDDVNTFAALARRRFPVGILSEATRGRLQRSARYRELLGPARTPHELRVAFVTRGRAWGAVALLRRDGSEDFNRSNARVMARLSRPIAEGLRASIRSDAARRSNSASAPGMIVVGARDEVELITPHALRLLDPLRRESPSAPEESPPPAILALAAIARSQATADARHFEGGLCVPTRDGWLALHASLPDGAGSKRVAIVIQPARSEQTASLRLEAYGLTTREREIATSLAQGLSTGDLARRLQLSPYTVQDHVKAIFEKTGVRTRRQLVARIFYDEYLPRIDERAPLGADGSFTGPP